MSPYGRIAYCGENVIPHLELSHISLVVLFTSKNRKYLTDNSIDSIAANCLELVYEDLEQTHEVSRRIKHALDEHTDKTVIFQCQYGKNRSYDAASAYSELLLKQGPIQLYLDDTRIVQQPVVSSYSISKRCIQTEAQKALSI